MIFPISCSTLPAPPTESFASTTAPLILTRRELDEDICAFNRPMFCSALACPPSATPAFTAAGRVTDTLVAESSFTSSVPTACFADTTPVKAPPTFTTAPSISTSRLLCEIARREKMEPRKSVRYAVDLTITLSSEMILFLATGFGFTGRLIRGRVALVRCRIGRSRAAGVCCSLISRWLIGTRLGCACRS